MEALLLLPVAGILGLIPAVIASGKGHNFFLWWLFGMLLFIIALPVSILVQPKEGQKLTQLDVVDKLDKLRRLRSEGIISDAEFDDLKQEVLSARRGIKKSGYDPTISPDPRPTRIILYGLGGAVTLLVLGFIVLALIS